jgi:parvulin-like peptidyl-prolyl isomerase
MLRSLLISSRTLLFTPALNLVSGFLLLCLMPTFCEWGFAADRVFLERVEASVNQAIVLNSDLRHFKKLLKLRGQLDPLFTGSAIASSSQPTDEQIRDFLVDEKLISQQFPVSDGEVEQEINTIQSNNKLDRRALVAAIKSEGFDFADYFELIRVGASKRNLLDREIRAKVTISEDDLKNHYFNFYATSSKAPRSYRLNLITVTIKNYKTPALAKDAAQQALKELKNGELFSEIAKKVSDDALASSGGELGTVPEDQIDPTVAAVVKKLKIGQVSDLIGGTQTGQYQIVKLLDIRTADLDHFNRVKDEIRNQLMAAEFQHQITLWLERQRQTAYIHRAGEPFSTSLPLQK